MNMNTRMNLELDSTLKQLENTFDSFKPYQWGSKNMEKELATSKQKRFLEYLFNQRLLVGGAGFMEEKMTKDQAGDLIDAILSIRPNNEIGWTTVQNQLRKMMEEEAAQEEQELNKLEAMADLD